MRGFHSAKTPIIREADAQNSLVQVDSFGFGQSVRTEDQDARSKDDPEEGSDFICLCSVSSTAESDELADRGRSVDEIGLLDRPPRLSEMSANK